MNFNKKQKIIKPLYVKIFLIVVLIFGIVGILTNILNANKESIQSAVQSAGIWGPGILFFARGISIIIPALPSSIFSVIAGGALGFKSGYLTIVLADFICCQIAFFIARKYGRLPVRKIVGLKAMERIESFNQNQLEENFFLMTGLLMTGLFDFLSYSIGLGGTRWKTFTPALIISLLTSDSILVAVGAGISEGKNLLLGGALLGMFALATISGLIKCKKPIWLINWCRNIWGYQSRFRYSLTKWKFHKK